MVTCFGHLSIYSHEVWCSVMDQFPALNHHISSKVSALLSKLGTGIPAVACNYAYICGGFLRSLYLLLQALDA